MLPVNPTETPILPGEEILLLQLVFCRWTFLYQRQIEGPTLMD